MTATTVGAAGQSDALRAEIVEDLELAYVSRALDDKELTLQKQSKVFFQISGAGHEALLLGLARDLRAGYDWFFPYYRDRALMLGLGVEPVDIMRASVGAETDPMSHGRQMPSHWSDRARHVVSQTSATGSQLLPAVGCAEAGRYASAHPEAGVPFQPDEITYVSLGEGTASQGEFWEAVNAAALMQLPVLFVVADNGWAISVPRHLQLSAPVSDQVRNISGLRVETVDGTDYAEVRRTSAAVVAHLRGGGGPVLLHALVTRPYSHSAADTQAKYRSSADLDDERSIDPIQRMSESVLALGLLSESELEELKDRARATVDRAASVALTEPVPDPRSVLQHVVAPLIPLAAAPDMEPPPGDDDVTMSEAIRTTLAEVMHRDSRVRVFGEDVADAPIESIAEVEGKGGVFGTTFGLQRQFGEDRCFNTPLAEAAIVGRAVGQAIRGLRPAPEVQFFDYVWAATQQIKTEAATMRWRSAGAWSVPMVLRIPIGGYLAGGAIWHSQSGESFFAHIPGLLIAMPSRAVDAAGLLRTAFEIDDPVLFLEHKHLYRQDYARGPATGPDFTVPFGRGRIARPGGDVTVITWGATVHKSVLAAEALATEGVDVEVIDLRTIVPWDQQIVADSVARTGRALVVHEDIVTGGWGAEIAVWIGEMCFDDLLGPVRRVGALDSHVGYAPSLESAVLPQVGDIVGAVRNIF